jgi:type I restriction enzyme, S subunit
VLWVTPTDIKSLVISNTAKKLSQVGVTKARIAKAGSILVTSIASIGKNTLLRMDAGFNQQINSLTPTSENDSYFLLTQSEKWSEKMKQTAASATMQIVNKTDFSNISTYVPVHKEEQEKIGSFFKQLDDTIALHQRKLDLLKEQKKGYLQKMFPKNGAKVPELRFAGFADDWEERKLKELGDIQTGNTPPTSDSDNYSLDGVLWVTPTDIKSLVISNTAKKLSQVGVTKARIAKAGSILVTSIASIGKNTLLRMDAGFNQQINSLTPTSENDSYFLLTQSEKWSEKMKQTAASATMQIVNKTDFSNISTYVPVHKEEQEKIGSFFKQLDDTIALHQRKLDLLKEQKKGFLQKMFV